MRVLAGIVGVALVVVYAVVSGLWVSTGDSWYRSLDRPPWQPPGVVIGLIWPYNFLMLIVVGIVIAASGSTGRILAWLGALAVSVVTALAWAHLFYVDRMLWPSAVALLVAALVNLVGVVVAFRVQAWAGVALVPYGLWLLIAVSLAVGYAVRNPAAGG